MVMDSLNLKLRQIATFSSNAILDKMSSAKSEERPLCHMHLVTSRSFCPGDYGIVATIWKYIKRPHRIIFHCFLCVSVQCCNEPGLSFTMHPPYVMPQNDECVKLQSNVRTLTPVASMTLQPDCLDYINGGKVTKFT